MFCMSSGESGKTGQVLIWKRVNGSNRTGKIDKIKPLLFDFGQIPALLLGFFWVSSIITLWKFMFFPIPFCLLVVIHFDGQSSMKNQNGGAS